MRVIKHQNNLLRRVVNAQLLRCQDKARPLLGTETMIQFEPFWFPIPIIVFSGLEIFESKFPCPALSVTGHEESRAACTLAT